jgi:hypothetical protein
MRGVLIQNQTLSNGPYATQIKLRWGPDPLPRQIVTCSQQRRTKGGVEVKAIA